MNSGANNREEDAGWQVKPKSDNNLSQGLTGTGTDYESTATVLDDDDYSSAQSTRARSSNIELREAQAAPKSSTSAKKKSARKKPCKVTARVRLAMKERMVLDIFVVSFCTMSKAHEISELKVSDIDEDGSHIKICPKTKAKD